MPSARRESACDTLGVATDANRRGDPSVGTKLYVGNLNYNTTEDTLREAFGANGREVASVSIIMDRETGRSRGFAFVEMTTPRSRASRRCKELDGQDLDGRMLRINEAREREARGPGGCVRRPAARRSRRRWLAVAVAPAVAMAAAVAVTAVVAAVVHRAARRSSRRRRRLSRPPGRRWRRLRESPSRRRRVRRQARWRSGGPPQRPSRQDRARARARAAATAARRSGAVNDDGDDW